MHPEIAGVRVYFPLVGVAVVTGIATFVGLARRAGWPLRDAIRFELILTIGALLGAYLYSLVERGIVASILAGDWSSLLRVAFRYPGGLVGALVAAPLAARSRPARIGWLATADFAAPAVGGGMVVVRVGCLLQGCCFGRTTDLPWGIRFPADSPAWFAQLLAGQVEFGMARSQPVHPLQIYFAVLALVAALASLRLIRNGARRGRAAAAFLAIHETGRALLEPLRVPPLLHLQLFSALLGAAGLVASALLRARATKAEASAQLADASACPPG
jgi:phosphatidylglycerol:prolipoprotein diacylglycerol transferase